MSARRCILGPGVCVSARIRLTRLFYIYFCNPSVDIITYSREDEGNKLKGGENECVSSLIR